MKEKKVNRARPGRASEVGQLIGLTGMNAQETADYLNARGIKCSVHSVKAWTKDAYNPLPEAIEALWLLWESLEDPLGVTPLPDEAPQSVRDRLEDLEALRIWIAERRPDDNPPDPND